MPSKGQPLFVVLEGLDGAGTTTQSELLAGALRARDLRVCLTAEPSDGPLGRVLRAHLTEEVELDPVTAALTFTADRADHLARTIRPALARGEWVVCDRYLLSTLAYQGASASDREWILAVSHGFPAPDVTIYLDVPSLERAGRMSARGRGVERYEAPELTADLERSYAESIEMLRSAGHRIDIVGGSDSAAAVHEAILTRLDAIG